ncbi:MAG TPA: M1 family metallopeptidase [Nocardioides sp.]|nr:M1 family metallopeptidase [Nocardioides sp.]
MPSHARILAAAVGLGLLLPTGAAAARTADSTGSSGIGDPYYADYGNGGYDVDHYDIRVSYRPRTDRLAGTTRIRAHTTQELSRFDLDFVLPVSGVEVNHRPASFRRTGHELVVTPRTALRAGQAMTVEVSYRGKPSKVRSHGAQPWIRTRDGAVAGGKPEGAAWWYPANDHPRDKATYDVRVTVAKGLEAVGNGVLVSTRATHGQRTWHWRETDPMAPHLAFFVVGQLDLRRTRVDGRPMVTAVAPGRPRREGRWATAALARTPEIVEYGARQFGAYPFAATGGVAAAVKPGWSVESQTRPVYSRSFWHDGPNVYVVVHQVAHQWFGDSVSVDSWRDSWLSEGFASYAEWRWSEMHAEGSGRQLFRAAWDDHVGDGAFWRVAIGDPGAHQESNIAVLDRGAMALQALRVRIGGPAFFSVLRAWTTQHRHGNAAIDDFVALAEAESREDLGSFFDTWLHAPERPAPTRANGFPRNFDDAADTASPPPSWGPISRTHALLAAHD